MFDLTFLTSDVNRQRYALTVGIITLQGCVLALTLTLFVHQTQGSITEGKETVIVGIQTVAVARETGYEKLKLVIGPLTYMNALTSKDIFKMIGDLLHILGLVHGHNDIIMGIDELLALTGNDILHLLDILNGKEVAGIRHRGMTVTLLIQQGEFSLLVGKKDNLVINEGVHLRNMVKVGHDIDWHDTIVDSHINIGTKDTGKTDRVHIQQAVDLGLTMTHIDALAVNLEIIHTDSLVTKIKGKEAVGINAGCFNTKEGDIVNTTIL